MDKAAKPRRFFFSFFEKLMVPPIKRNASTKQASFLQKRKERLKLEDPEHFTIAQLKAMLRAANVSERDISLCIERSQLDTLYKERLDEEFRAVVKVQRHWRKLQDYRKAKKAREKMKREGVIDDEEASTATGVHKKHDIFSKLSNREIEFYQEVFEKIDVDGSGEIDDQELQQALHDLGHEADEEKVAEMVSEVGKGGVVDFEGFLKLVTSDKRLDPSKNAKAMLSKAKIKKYQKAFHAFDIDGSGEIDAWELKCVLELMGQHPSDDQVQELIKSVDTDGGGSIGFDEFLTLMTQPGLALAQTLADRMEALGAEVGANIAILKMWRFMAAELNPRLGRPRLADPKMVLRNRAGCVCIRTAAVAKTFIEKRPAADTNEMIEIPHTVQCKEVQVLLVSSTTYPSLWVLPSGGQRVPLSHDGEMNGDAQTAEEAALQHTADEAGAIGDIAAFLGLIEDHWKSTLTRWFHLDNVVFEDDYKRPLDIWTEKDRRKRKWFPLISEEVEQEGQLPPNGKLGSKYTVIGQAAEHLLWRRPLHQAVHAYVDGYTAVGEPLMLSVKRNWDGNACSPSHRAKAWCCIDAASGALVLGVEASYSDDPRPRSAPGPTQDLDSFESVAFYLASQAAATRSDVDIDDINYLQVIIGPHGHYLAQNLRGNRKVVLSSLSHEDLMRQEWYKMLLPKQREPRRASINMCKTAISHDKSKWVGVIVVPRAFLPLGPRFCGNFYSIFGPKAESRNYLATFPVPQYREHFGTYMHQDVIGDRLHPDMHAFLAFQALNVPVLPHLCNWTLDSALLIQAVGPKTVAAERDKVRAQQEADPRASDRLALRTPSYPGIKSQTIPWKDKSRPPTRIGDRAVPGGCAAWVVEKPPSRIAPDSDPWQHPGASSPFAKVKDKVNKGLGSTAVSPTSPLRSIATRRETK